MSKEIIYLNDENISAIDMYVGNKEVHLLRYFEPEPGIFIAESKNVIDRALEMGYAPISAISFPKKISDPVFDRLGDIPVYVGEQAYLQEYLGYKMTTGISCAMRRKPAMDFKDVICGARRIAVLEGVVNPTNVGAIFRSAAALNIDAVLLSPACADPLYRRAIRVSVGNIFVVPWAFICRTEEEWKTKGIDVLHENGFKTVAMALREDNITIDDPILKTEDKLAIIMGTEGDGLAASTIEACDYVAKIPMVRGVDSLNVAVAASLAFWEITKRI